MEKTDKIDRIRRIDVEKLSDEDCKNIEDGLSKKIKEITEKAVSEANKYLNVYGMKAVMVIEFKPMEEQSLD